MNYYNEIDPYCAAWLQNLMDAGHIAPGVIDTRSIEDVRPDELAGYTQCHFFAGLGGWAYALDLAGWPRDRPVWTGSCPCQPFSATGKGTGFADERHLWPAWQHLIAQCRPPIIFGEQVASKDAEPWIDLVHADMEGMGYAFGCVPFPSAGVGAPHIRDRNYWVADAYDARLEGWCALPERPNQRVAGEGGVAGGMEHSGHNDDAAQVKAAGYRQSEAGRPADIAGGSGLSSGGMADPDGRHASAERQQRGGEQRQQPQDGGIVRVADSHIVTGGQGRAIDGGRHQGSDAQSRPGPCGSGMPHRDTTGPTNGFWRDADWLGCTDGKWRPTQSTHECMADGVSDSLGYVRTGDAWSLNPLIQGAKNRVGRLRAYGNAICAPAAETFIRSYLDASHG